MFRNKENNEVEVEEVEGAMGRRIQRTDLAIFIHFCNIQKNV